MQILKNKTTLPCIVNVPESAFAVSWTKSIDLKTFDGYPDFDTNEYGHTNTPQFKKLKAKKGFVPVNLLPDADILSEEEIDDTPDTDVDEWVPQEKRVFQDHVWFYYQLDGAVSFVPGELPCTCCAPGTKVCSKAEVLDMTDHGHIPFRKRQVSLSRRPHA
jgi:hypothetical protein